MREVQHRDIILGEVERLVEEFAASDEVDQALIDFLCGHILRYIATLRVQTRARADHPSVVRARQLLERLAAIADKKAGYVIPFEDETAVIKRFLEAEDIEILSMQFDSIIEQMMALQKEVDQLREHAATAADTTGIAVQAQELSAELELRDHEIVRLRQIIKERLESVVQGRREAIGLPGEENGVVASGCDHEITLAKWKQQMKEFSARYKALESSLKATQDEDARKAKEIGDWRRKFVEVQSTLKERIENRARELASATAGSTSELRARAEKLNTIEASNLVFPGTDGSYYVFPRTIVRALDVKPGETLSFMIDAGGVKIVKAGRPR